MTPKPLLRDQPPLAVSGGLPWTTAQGDPVVLEHGDRIVRWCATCLAFTGQRVDAQPRPPETVCLLCDRRDPAEPAEPPPEAP